MADSHLQWWNDIAGILASKVVPPVFRPVSTTSEITPEVANDQGLDSKRDTNMPPRPPSSPRSSQPPRGCSESSPEYPDRDATALHARSRSASASAEPAADPVE
eukprot:CAMPEP_0172199336 /NCGR_PEP_ID=MMETSP1050-20130122/28628_1 /TAXON_ID=233186 /ORGANISM="Cryptomonas curvata, Strain CCAP979/52" /LENGTH=103 /DNA_ID=CAMNT_0012876341 /DNA_START=77 /DNA_END=385 /DNA_ORIENTATION=+